MMMLSPRLVFRKLQELKPGKKQELLATASCINITIFDNVSTHFHLESSRKNADKNPPNSKKARQASNLKQRFAKFHKFAEGERDYFKRLNRDFALPYVNIDDMNKDKEAFQYHYQCQKSPLYNLWASGAIAKPNIDINYVINNKSEVTKNIKLRKCGNIDIEDDIVQPNERLAKVEEEARKYAKAAVDIKSELEAFEQLDLSIEDKEVYHSKLMQSLDFANNIVTILQWVRVRIQILLYNKLILIPNRTYVNENTGEDGNILEVVGEKKSFEHKVYDHITICNKMKILRQKRMKEYAGDRNYFLIGQGAELEQALIAYTTDKLRSKGFMFMTVPNVLRDAAFDAAGLYYPNMDTMVYQVNSEKGKDHRLAGTSEIGICTYFSNHAMAYETLPRKVCAVSTCYRKETGTRLDPHGLFRVHQFAKVEMFAVTGNESGDESAEVHLEFVEIQKEICRDLGLHCNVIDMPGSDLGLPAYRKIDIEAWFPGRNSYAEISSASNCTDFQSRRLNILYNVNGDYKHAHTVNATACAVPRVIIALLENGQQPNKTVRLPKCLHPYMGGRTELTIEKGRDMEYIGIKQSKKQQKRPID